MSEGISEELEKYRHRKLPHWKRGGGTYFVTFRSTRGSLPANCLSIVKEVVEYEDQRRIQLWGGCIMPDHVHIAMHRLEIERGTWHDVSQVLKSIKGVSARRINPLLGTSGSVWQKESYDRLVRDVKEFHDTRHYIWMNPVRSGLVSEVVDWPFQLGLNHLWD